MFYYYPLKHLIIISPLGLSQFPIPFFFHFYFNNIKTTWLRITKYLKLTLHLS